MRLEYTLTLKDYKAAFKLHRRRKMSRRLIAWLGPILLVIGVAGFVACSVANNTALAAQAAALAAGSLYSRLDCRFLGSGTFAEASIDFFRPERSASAE